MMEKIITLLASNSFVKILLIAVALDTILGVLRAIKEHKFNSCVGIDGAIRKAYKCIVYDSGAVYTGSWD